MSPISLDAGRLAGASLLRLQSDRRLLDLARAGNRDAFGVIAGRYHGELLRHAERLVGAARGEDAVQQALLNAHRALELPHTDVADPRPWLHRIVRNVALNTLRQPGACEEPLDERLVGSESPALTCERRERLRETVAAVRALPERQRRAMLMRELEGLSHAQIALELGVAPGAARQLIHRARDRMRAAASAVIPIGLLLPRSGQVPGDPAGAGGGGAAAGAASIVVKVGVTVAVGAGAVGIGVQPALEDRARPVAKADRPLVTPVPAGASAGAGAVLTAQSPSPLRADRTTVGARGAEAGIGGDGASAKSPSGERSRPGARSPEGGGEPGDPRPGTGTGGAPGSDRRGSGEADDERAPSGARQENGHRAGDAGDDAGRAADDADDADDDAADPREDAADTREDAADDTADTREDAADDTADAREDADDAAADTKEDAEDEPAPRDAEPAEDEDEDEDED